MKRSRTDKVVLWDEAKKLFDEIARLKENIDITKDSLKKHLEDLKTFEEKMDDLYKKIQSERKILEEKKEILKQKQNFFRKELRNMNDPVKEKDYFKQEFDTLYLECQTLTTKSYENDILLINNQKVWEKNIREYRELYHRLKSLENIMSQTANNFRQCFKQ